MGTIFVAGTYGVGKSTLCHKLSEGLNVPEYSAGDIISEVNDEDYHVEKFVKDKAANQHILASKIQHLLAKFSTIILAGHFCIFDEKKNIDHLPQNVFFELGIGTIILLEAQVPKIIENLFNRDGKCYSERCLAALQKEERKVAHEIANDLRCNFYVHHMNFDETDVEECLSYLRGLKS